MVTHMKTTIEIADDLLERAKRRARRENKTLREIVDEALRRQIDSMPDEKPFRYRPHTVKGKGLQAGISEGNWEQVRDLIHKTK
jgi:Arc/MetJ family transcription regulator